MRTIRECEGSVIILLERNPDGERNPIQFVDRGVFEAAQCLLRSGFPSQRKGDLLLALELASALDAEEVTRAVKIAEQSLWSDPLRGGKEFP